jgi:hypothetical protein
MEESAPTQTEELKDDGGTFGPTGTSSGNRLGQTLKREQREQLERNYRENLVTGKEGEADHRFHKQSLRKRRNVGTSVDI